MSQPRLTPPLPPPPPARHPTVLEGTSAKRTAPRPWPPLPAGAPHPAGWRFCSSNSPPNLACHPPRAKVGRFGAALGRLGAALGRLGAALGRCGAPAHHATPRPSTRRHRHRHRRHVGPPPGAPAPQPPAIAPSWRDSRPLSSVLVQIGPDWSRLGHFGPLPPEKRPGRNLGPSPQNMSSLPILARAPSCSGRLPRLPWWRAPASRRPSAVGRPSWRPTLSHSICPTPQREYSPRRARCPTLSGPLPGGAA
jgi:hypothetical protein